MAKSSGGGSRGLPAETRSSAQLSSIAGICWRPRVAGRLKPWGTGGRRTWKPRANTAAETLEFWLRSVHARSPEARVVVVATHLDKHPSADVGRDRLARQRWPPASEQYALQSV